MRKKIVFSMLFLIMICTCLLEGKAATPPKYHEIPAYQEKDFYETKTVDVEGITVEETINSILVPVEKEITFQIFNSTKQEFENKVVSKNGKLPTLKLIQNHNYIIMAEDTEYTMENVYLWVKDGKLVDIKVIGDIDQPTYDYPEVKSLQLQKRKNPETDPVSDNRVMINLPVRYGEALLYNVKIKLVSAYETLEVSSGNKGYLRTTLLEDVPYMLSVEHSTYDVETFPLVVKDKSEYGAGKYTYDFSSCKMVEAVALKKKELVHENDTKVTSVSERVTVEGMNFKDFIIIDKTLDVSLDTKLDVHNYEVVDIIMVNPHRWEVGKFPVGEYKISLSMNKDKKLKNLYYWTNDDLYKLDYKQDEQKIYFTLNTMSMCPVVLEYEEPEVVLKAPVSAAATLSGKYDKVKFTWKKVQNASGYYVYMKTATAKNYTYLGRTTNLSYTKGSLKDGVRYYFKVVPYHLKNGKRIKANVYKTANVYTLKKLNMPKVVKATSKKVKVSWNNISGETGYQISRSTKKTGTNIVSTYSTTSGKVKQLSVSKNKTYYYKVRAYKTVNGKKIFGPWSKVKSYKLK